MAYDEVLANRIREALQDHDGVTEKKMFGGLGFMIRGNMAAAADSRGGLMLRVDPEVGDRLIDGEHIEPMEMRGRVMTGWLHVDAARVDTDEQLSELLAHGVGYASSLPAK